MNTVNLNLARKWRSKNFDQIVGQDLPVRILKNSLYLNQFFPVYLFSGQRGCGKTSMARVFAASVNCEKLSEFQKNPKAQSVPCGNCTSCLAMARGQHPDFIEIDAASHTGVDNVRQIIDAASLLPVLGRKKIYLIDEAHMLSKAAFNAFLKIMEEPPVGVLFILATTDSQKIIETVRSRCFQLFFKPVEQERMIKHLAYVCKEENIRYELNGLDLIIAQSEGSIRDALNILEQVRFSSSMISAQTVRNALGHIDDEKLIELMSHVMSGEIKKLVTFLHEQKLEHYSSPFIFKRCIELLKSALWVKQGVIVQSTIASMPTFKQMIKKFDSERFFDFIELLYTNELVFQKTSSQQNFLEMILLQLCQKNKRRNNSSGSAPLVQQPIDGPVDENECEEEEDEEDQEDQDEMPVPPAQDEDDEAQDEQWVHFLNKVTQLNDPLLDSIFKQGTVQSSHAAIVEISFSENLIFFKEWLDESRHKWFPLFQQTFKKSENLKVVFSPNESKKEIPTQNSKIDETGSVQEMRMMPVIEQRSLAYKKTSNFARKKIDVSDASIWKKTNMVLKFFPGTVTAEDRV